MADSFSLTDLASAPSRLELRAIFSHASPEFLFDAFTRPVLLAQWWVPQAEIDPYPYGSYRFQWQDQGTILFGTLLTYHRGKHLKFTWKWAHAPEVPQRTVDIRFSASPAGAVLHLTHGNYDASPRDLQDRENHRTGWHHFLAQLAQLVETAHSRQAADAPAASEAL